MLLLYKTTRVLCVSKEGMARIVGVFAFLNKMLGNELNLITKLIKVRGGVMTPSFE